jgi:hypothetical protein
MRRRSFLISSLVFFLASMFGFLTRVDAMTLYVSPEGSDRWSGLLAQPNVAKTDGPVATLERARDLIRQSRNGTELREPVRIVVAGGIYTMTAPFVLAPQDSGTDRSSITYEAAPGVKPVFTGGRAITGLQLDGDGTWKTRIADVASGPWYFEQLFVNGRRAVRARRSRISRDTERPQHVFVVCP